MQFQHVDNAQNGEFYLDDDLGKRIAEISYIWNGEDKIIANHTWVDDSLRGQGVARQLLDVLVAFAREREIKVIPLCPFFKSVFDKDQSIHDVLKV